MLPVANSITLYPQITSPLINTVTPGTTVAHVPYDNVAPSVSNAQVDNNSKDTNPIPPPLEQAAPSSESTDAEFSLAMSNASGFNINAQATFLAQLIGQDVSVPPETAGILVQYEKIVAFSNVKYKPSNAQKPAPEPAGVFGTLMHQETAQPVTPPEPTQAVTATVVEKPVVNEAPVVPVHNPAPQAAGAYEATVQRANLLAATPATELA